MVHHSKFLFSALVVSAMAAGANAQVTTSAISGKVLDETKAPVIGATVVAIHEPSGTLYGAVTNVDGRYTIQGMRTGGPYKIEISYVGYNKTTYTGISLELGNTLSLNAEMKPSSELLDEVVVVADAKANAGAAHNFSTQKIENTPTVDRNVYDIVKNMPMAMTSKNGGITFAGSNNRYSMPLPSRVLTPLTVRLTLTSTTRTCMVNTVPYAIMKNLRSLNSTLVLMVEHWAVPS